MNYAQAAENAAKKIQAKGAAIKIIRPGNPSGWTKSWDPLGARWQWEEDGTGTIVYTDPAIDEVYPTHAIVSPASAGAVQAFDIRFESGTLLESNLRSLMIAAHGLAIRPKPGDIVELAGERWTLLGNTPLMPDGETAIYHNGTVKRGG